MCPLLLGVSMAVWGMASSGRLTWQAGIALLTATVMNIIWEMRTAGEHPEEGEEIDENDRSSSQVAAFKLAGGLVLLVAGSHLLVKGAVGAAQQLGVSETVIGLTIVAAGTSMPELVTSLVAAYRGKADLAIGNVVGSNLLNQLVILGLCATVTGSRGLAVDPVLIARDLPLMVLTTLACLPIFWTDGVITRLEGGILLAALPVLLVFLVWQSLRWREQRHRQA